MSAFTWTIAAGGDWALAGNWIPSTVPDADTATASIPGRASTGYTVAIAAGESEIVNAVTLGDLTIGHAGPTLAVAGMLDFAGTSPSMAFLSGVMRIDNGGVLAGTGALGTSQGPGPFVLVNNGTMHADAGTNQQLAILVGFTNNGTVLADNGIAGIEGPSGLTNLSGTTLTGGTWIAQGPTAGTFNQIELGFNFDAVIGVDAANIVLDGAASDIQGYTGGNFQPIEQQLQSIAATGTLQLLDNRGYTTTLALQDDGTLIFQGGTLSSGGLAIGATGTLDGFGVVTGGIANQGGVIADGGALDLTTSVSGTGGLGVSAGSGLILNGATSGNVNNNGTIYVASGLLEAAGQLAGKGTVVVQNGATLEFATGTSQNITFSGSNAMLRLDNYAGYTGTLAGFAQGDTLVLAGTSATKAFVSGGSLAVVNNASTVDTIALAGSYAAGATFSVANVGTNAVVTNTDGAPLRQDFAFTILPVNDTVGLGSTEDAQIVGDLNAAALDWAQYLTGHANLRILLNIEPGTQGAELANATPTINLSNGMTLDGRLLDTPSSLIALNTGNYAPGLASDITINLFAGNLGSIYVNPAPTPMPSGSVPSGQFDLVTVFRHELGHGFGFGGLTTSNGALDGQETLFDHYIESIDGTVVFTGPAAEAAYGALLGSNVATPVPLTTLNNGEGFAHFANSQSEPNATDLMSGLGLPPATQRDISTMDLAVLQDVGAPVTAGLVAAAPTPRTLVWTGAAGNDLGTAGNWNDTTNGLNPAATAPGSIDSAEFTSGAGVITGSGTASAVTFDSNGDWQLTSKAAVTGLSQVSIGSGSASSVSVTSGAELATGGGLSVGSGGTGILSVTLGGSVAAGVMDIATLVGGAGIVSAVGAGSSISVTGQLTVGDSASAELSILNGATVSGSNADVGRNVNGTGDIDIEGTGSELSLSGDLNLGDAGTGVLTLGNNTTLQVAGNLNIGANGVLNQFGGVIDPSVVNNTGRAGGKGSISASVSIANSGTLFAASGTETLSAPTITGTGALEIDSKGDLAVNVGSVVTTQTVSFTDGTGVLTIGTLGGFAATIGNIIAGDSIMVQGTSIASLSFDASTHVLTLFDPSQAEAGVLQFGSSVTDQSLISVNGLMPCFVAGTRISTERGEVCVEELRVGDWVQVVSTAPSPQPPPARGGGVRARALALTGTEYEDPPSPCGRGLGGGGRAKPIIWLGDRTVDCARHPEPRKVWPVRIAAHAFGPGRPSCDLWLSPDHALYIDDVLIPAKYLINGTTIAQVPRDSVTYFHLELPQHAILLAEGLPAESYLDTGDRVNFANNGGPTNLHPDFASRVWDAAGCAPLIVTGPLLHIARGWVNNLAQKAEAA